MRQANGTEAHGGYDLLLMVPSPPCWRHGSSHQDSSESLRRSLEQLQIDASPMAR